MVEKKEIKKETKKETKKEKKSNKKMILYLSSLLMAIIILIVSGLLFYQHYENTKPIGVTKVTNSKNITPTKNDVLKYQNKDNESRQGWLYLFEAQITQVRNSNKEFVNADAFQKNLLTLDAAGSVSDIDQASALWTRNSTNYDFTTDTNTITSGIGHDTLIYNKYLGLVKNMTLSAASPYVKDMGKSIKERFQTPMTMAIIGSQLSVKSQNEFITDKKSAIDMFSGKPTQYISTTFYKNESDLKKVKKVATLDSYQNEALNAYNYLGSDKVNGVYDVLISDTYGTKVHAYIVEDGIGALFFWGFYYENQDNIKKDGDLEHYQDLVNQYGDDSSNASASDVTWSAFVKATK